MTVDRHGARVFQVWSDESVGFFLLAITMAHLLQTIKIEIMALQLIVQRLGVD